MGARNFNFASNYAFLDEHFLTIFRQPKPPCPLPATTPLVVEIIISVAEGE